MGTFATTPNAGLTLDEYRKILRDNGIPDEVALKLYRALPTADEKASFPSGASASDPLALASAIPTTGWTTRYSVDFSALPALDIKTPGDGAVVIDGKTWQSLNMANATALDLDGSTGLVFDVANGTYDYGTRTAPYLYALITSLWSGYNVANHKLRVWAHFNYAPVNNWDSFMCMLERQGGVGGELMAGAIFRHNGSTVDEWALYHGSAGGASGFSAHTSHTTDDVVCIEQTERGIIVRSGTYAAGFPNIEDMNQHGHVTYDKSGDLLLGLEQANAVVSFSNFKDSGAPADATLVAFQLDSIG